MLLSSLAVFSRAIFEKLKFAGRDMDVIIGNTALSCCEE